MPHIHPSRCHQGQHQLLPMSFRYFIYGSISISNTYKRSTHPWYVSDKISDTYPICTVSTNLPISVISDFWSTVLWSIDRLNGFTVSRATSYKMNCLVGIKSNLNQLPTKAHICHCTQFKVKECFTYLLSGRHHLH